MIDALIDNQNFIYIDETGFNNHTRPLFGYSTKGKRPILKEISRGPNHSVAAVITRNRLVGYKMIKGSFHQTNLVHFLIELINMNTNILDNRNNWILIMDNAPIHKSQVVKHF